ncbi:MAG: hypothetical protein ACQESQ_12350, partial [Bacteroidota bacterium]
LLKTYHKIRQKFFALTQGRQFGCGRLSTKSGIAAKGAKLVWVVEYCIGEVSGNGVRLGILFIGVRGCENKNQSILYVPPCILIKDKKSILPSKQYNFSNKLLSCSLYR